MAKASFYAIVGDVFNDPVRIVGPFSSAKEAGTATEEDRKHEPVEIVIVAAPQTARTEPDEEGPHIVAVGTVMNGFKFFGPFPGFTAADQYAGDFSLPTHIIKLDSAAVTTG